ncbi:YcxB family protein [Kitasatospora atroaurantiaca]|uniref:YcxB family protein n=1 Tax=Kitasatospora atroaurantiaca TaxID=285545 RepID=UPI0014795330|nr:YcxB family protein [Kitasatospora atroaurantiaca]
MDITATFQMTAREYRSAIRNSPAVRGAMIIGLLLAGSGLLSLLSGDPKTWLVYYGIGVPVFMEVAAVRLASRKSAALLAEPWTVRVTEETYTLRTAASQAEVGWSVYREVNDRSGFWYLRQLNGASGFLPKRAFGDPEQAELADFFARRLPPRKKRWYRPFA